MSLSDVFVCARMCVWSMQVVRPTLIRLVFCFKSECIDTPQSIQKFLYPTSPQYKHFIKTTKIKSFIEYPQYLTFVSLQLLYFEKLFFLFMQPFHLHLEKYHVDNNQL